MADATERLVNLALFLADSRDAVTARTVREQVVGYPADQDEDAFLRMFERDKKELRASGLVIETVELSSGNAYRFDRSATFQAPVELTAQDVSVLRAVGSALVSDPSFPFGSALATALAKLSAPPVATVTHAPDEPAAHEADAAATLARACVSRKTATFGYRNAKGIDSDRTVEPYGIFLREGAWYLVGRDPSVDETRVFAVRRMRDVTANPTRPGTPDFAPPEGFDSAAYVRLPFQYGNEDFDAELVFEADLAWRAPALTEGYGSLRPADDGAVVWIVDAADAGRLARWVIENGPGITIAGPAAARTALLDGVARAVSVHG